MDAKKINKMNAESKKKLEQRRTNRTQTKIIKICPKCNKSFQDVSFSRCPTCKKDLLIQRDNMPKCPTCQSLDIKKISTASRSASVFVFGFGSSKIGKTFECNNCGYKW